MSDRPHSFVQYIIFRVLLYHKIPVYSLVSFNTFAPAVALFNESTEQFVNASISLNNEQSLKRDSSQLPLIKRFLDQYVGTFKRACDSNYKPDYMIKNKNIFSFKFLFNPSILLRNTCKKLIEYSSLVKSFFLKEYI